MANMGYVTVTGTKQGNMTEKSNTADSDGTTAQSDHQGASTVFSAVGVFGKPVDPASGQAAGEPFYEGLTVKIPWDASVPLLLNSLATGENVDVKLEYTRSKSDGSEENFYTTELNNAAVSKFHMVMPDTTRLDTAKLNPYVEVTFSTKKTTWTHETASTSGNYDYDNPTL